MMGMCVVSYDRNQTYDFTLGEGQVIKGVDLGLMNMCEGEIRRLTIPPILAYGDGGYGKKQMNANSFSLLNAVAVYFTLCTSR